MKYYIKLRVWEQILKFSRQIKGIHTTIVESWRQYWIMIALEKEIIKDIVLFCGGNPSFVGLILKIVQGAAKLEKVPS